MQFFRLLDLWLEKVLIVGFCASVSLWLKFLEQKLGMILYSGVAQSMQKDVCWSSPHPGFPFDLHESSLVPGNWMRGKVEAVNSWTGTHFHDSPAHREKAKCHGRTSRLWLYLTFSSCSSATTLPSRHAILLNGLQPHHAFSYIPAFALTVTLSYMSFFHLAT